MAKKRTKKQKFRDYLKIAHTSYIENMKNDYFFPRPESKDNAKT